MSYQRETVKPGPARLLTRVARRIAESNYAAALDQQDDFESLEAALDSYRQNAVDEAQQDADLWYAIDAEFAALVNNS